MRVTLVLILAVILLAPIKGETRGYKPDCNRYACGLTTKVDGIPRITLSSTTTEPLICFTYVQHKKHIYQLAPRSSKMFSLRQEKNYHYFSWNCTTMNACPIWGKRHC